MGAADARAVNDRSPIPRGRPGSALRSLVGAYVSLSRWIWRHLPSAVQRHPFCELYGRHLHWVVRRYAERKQYVATFFLRNRAELELTRVLAARLGAGSRVQVAVLACSKGAEVYSIAWALRSARPTSRSRSKPSTSRPRFWSSPNAASTRLRAPTPTARPRATQRPKMLSPGPRARTRTRQSSNG